MIKLEKINEKLVKHYSDKNLKIKQIETGIIYDEAIDIIPCKYTYEETNISLYETEESGE